MQPIKLREPAASIIALVIIALLLFPSQVGMAQAPLPNILYINVDDLGWKDLACMGSNYYETPNIDRLASQGMLFTQAYAKAANCAPSRACLMSGLNTPRHGIYTVSTSARGDSRTRQLIPTPNTEVLADSLYTLAEMLRDRGYFTGTFGKWHLGEDPTTQGFQVNAGGSTYGHPGKDGYFSPYNVKFLEDGPEGEYLTDRLTDEVLSFLKANQDTTFFVYLPYYSVHTPIMGKESLIRQFKNKPASDGQGRADYAAMIASVDQNVGRIMQWLEEAELIQNTLIIFTSDNGGIRSISQQLPLRAGKGSYYEGGIRVPLIIRWDEKIKADSRCSAPVTNMDMYPTLQAIVGGEQKSRKLDGVDISPLWRGEELADRPIFWHFPIYLEAYDQQMDQGRDPLFRTRPGSVVRFGDWKLHEYFEDGELELYNLVEDIGEERNLADTHPQKAKELHQLMVNWRKAISAPVPVERNPEYDARYEQDQMQQPSVKEEMN